MIDQPFVLITVILKFALWQAMAIRRGQLKNIHANKEAAGFNLQQYIHDVWEDLEDQLGVNYHFKFFINFCSGL